MAHFAQIDENNVVTQVIVADQNFINSGAVGDPSLWIQTSYNTKGGDHPNNTPLRKNFASIGCTYDSVRDSFIAPKPYPSWILDEDTCIWNPPTPMPMDGVLYKWDEASVSWKA